MKFRKTLLLMQLLMATFCVAQFPYTSKIACPDPLPTPVIYDMLSDSKGYLWLATDKGLIKFNSRSFQVLPFNNTQLKSVGYINEDEDGKVWCTNFYKQIFYVEHDSLKLFEVNGKAYNRLSNILNVSVTKQSIFVSSFKVIFEIDKTTHNIIRQTEANADNGFGFQFSLLFNKQFYYYCNNNILNSYENARIANPRNIQFLEARLASNAKQIIAIERGKRNRNAFSFDGKNFVTLPNFNIPKDAYVYHLAVTDENEFWICTQNGAYLWNYTTGATQLLFANERVSDVVKDFQGDYWFSTLDNGLFKCHNLSCRKLNNVFAKSDNATKILQLPNHYFAIGNTKGEIVKIDRNGKKIYQFYTATNDEIEFLHFDNEHKNLFSDGGLFNITSSKTIANIDFGKSVATDIYGNIIMATFNRCVIATNKFDAVDTVNTPQNNTFYKSLPTSYISINGRQIKKTKLLRSRRTTWVLANENKKGFWVAYDDDLYYYSYDGSIKIIKDKGRKSIQATHLVQYNNKLYASTTTNGLTVLNENGEEEKHFTTANGLQSNNAKKTIIEDNKIWVLTDESLEMIDVSTDLVQDFFSSVGLESLTVYDFALDSNRILLATPNGIMQYTQTENSLGERIKITQLIIENNNKEIVANTTLNYSENSIIVRLDAIHFKSPNKLYFHYRLVGSDSNWHIASASNNIINYNFLTAGNYVFEVYAADANMIFRSTISSIPFTIAKPFWQTWWFVCLLVIGILVVIYLIAKWWINKFKTEQTVKENLLQSKLTAIRSQMNPHFLYNVLNTVQGLVYANKKNEATEMLGNFSDLMRKTLQESDKTEIVLKDELDSLQLYLTLEKKRFDKEFEFNIEVGETIDITGVQVPSMFIQPFAENAIKHGLLHKEGMKNLSITIHQQENKLLVNIDDNGVGRKQSAIINKNKKMQSTGFAIKGIEDRMAIYNAMNKEKIEMEIVDKKVGTLVKLILPMK